MVNVVGVLGGIFGAIASNLAIGVPIDARRDQDGVHFDFRSRDLAQAFAAANEAEVIDTSPHELREALRDAHQRTTSEDDRPR